MIRLANVRRTLSTLAPRSFLDNFFGSREAKKKEIIAEQNDYEIDPALKITILNKLNSPDFKPFNKETDMPDFKIKQWKDQIVPLSNLSATYTTELLESKINSAYENLTSKTINSKIYKDTPLSDLEFRFNFAKLLQQKLGFDISDYTLSRAHDVEYLYGELKKTVASRWSNERNPNAIVLKQEDFASVGNVYLNNELTESEQQKRLRMLLAEAKKQDTKPVEVADST